MAAATIEIVFDGGFNDILLDYLDMQGRSSSEEAAFDEMPRITRVQVMTVTSFVR